MVFGCGGSVVGFGFGLGFPLGWLGLCRFRRLWLGVRCCFRLRCRFRGRGLLALEFVLELFVEAEGLLPAFEFVAGLLHLFFFLPPKKKQKSVRHYQKLRCGEAGETKGAGGERGGGGG